MTGETIVNVIGNTTADVELRYTQGGVAVASFTVASTPRIFNKSTNEWEDSEALFLRCTAWRELGEHAAASIPKGTRVIVSGYLKQRSYQDREGQSRTSIELDVQEIGPSLRYATAQVTRVQQGGGRPAQGQPKSEQQQVSGTEWAQPSPDYTDETPF